MHTATDTQDKQLKAAAIMQAAQQGDYSSFPPEVQDSIQKIKLLDMQAQKIVEQEMNPAVENAEKAAKRYRNLMILGGAAAGAVAGYLSGGMSWLPLIGTSVASAVGGAVATHFVARGGVDRATSEAEKIANKLGELQQQAQVEQQRAMLNGRAFAEKLMTDLQAETTPTPSHAANVSKTPSPSDIAAKKPAATHAEDAKGDGKNCCNQR